MLVDHAMCDQCALVSLFFFWNYDAQILDEAVDDEVYLRDTTYALHQVTWFSLYSFQFDCERWNIERDKVRPKKKHK